jgi:hypothetical protein
MEDVAAEFGDAEHGAALASETGRHKPRTSWEAVPADMAEHGAAANRERADAAERLAVDLRH